MLKPGGQFIIDFLNPEYTKTHLVPESERTYDGQLIKERRVIEERYVKKRIEIIDQTRTADFKAQPRHYLERIKLYTREDFTAMMEEAGLELKEIYGSYDEDFFDPLVSPRMIMVGDVSS